MKKIRIGFTGTRNGLNLEQKDKIKSFLKDSDTDTDTHTDTDIEVSHGDCVGADTDFHEIITQYNKEHPNKKIKIIIHPPDNRALRKFNQGDEVMQPLPYLERNSRIVETCDILIGCPLDKNNEELRSGTWSTIRKARKKGKIVYLF